MPLTLDWTFQGPITGLGESKPSHLQKDSTFTGGFVLWLRVGLLGTVARLSAQVCSVSESNIHIHHWCHSWLPHHLHISSHVSNQMKLLNSGTFNVIVSEEHLVFPLTRCDCWDVIARIWWMWYIPISPSLSIWLSVGKKSAKPFQFYPAYQGGPAHAQNIHVLWDSKSYAFPQDNLNSQCQELPASSSPAPTGGDRTRQFMGSYKK